MEITDQVTHYNQIAQNKQIIEVLEQLSKDFADKIVFSTSFGQEDQVITDFIFSNNINIPIFTLDTGRLFNETYKVYNKTLRKYNKQISVYFPETKEIEKLYVEKGPFSFYESIENRKECCNIRKVYPLKRALKNASCWVTGLRGGQSQARTNLQIFQWDEGNKILKYNPLLNWTYEEVLDYINTKNIPYNVLHDRGFVSIGCEPCTRAIADGEDIRAGRWWWESNSKKECGLHAK